MICFIDNLIEKLEGDIVSAINKISEFRAANNKVKIIDKKLLKRLKKSQLIDLSSNNCINLVYEKNSNASIKLNSMVCKIYLECTDDDE